MMVLIMVIMWVIVVVHDDNNCNDYSAETDFRLGGWINIWGGVLLLALAGAWWQRP